MKALAAATYIFGAMTVLFDAPACAPWYGRISAAVVWPMITVGSHLRGLMGVEGQKLKCFGHGVGYGFPQ